MATNTHLTGAAGGQVFYANSCTSCESTPLYAGGLSVEWYATEVLLDSLNATSIRTPLRTDVIPDPPMLLAPGAQGSVNVPAPPANAQFAVLVHKVSASSSLTGPDVVSFRRKCMQK